MEFYSGLCDDEDYCDECEALKKKLDLAVSALKYYKSREYDSSTAHQTLEAIKPTARKDRG
jgi:hypothetical protein